MSCDLYRYFDNKNRLLYVGVSINAIIRMHSHKTNALWFCLARKIEIEKFPDRNSALIAEKQSILSENPIYNLSHNQTIKKEKVARMKIYSKIKKQEILDYLNVSNVREMAKLLKCSSVYLYDKLEEEITVTVFFNILKKMKSCKIKIPKHWKSKYH